MALLWARSRDVWLNPAFGALLAAGVMARSSVFVLGNALRLRRWRAE